MTIPTIRLNDGRAIPQLGLGVWQLPDKDAPALVGAALKAGYRAVDTAAAYNNEPGVGAAVAGSGIPRPDLFITTKLRNDDQGFDAALKALDKSLERLKLDYVDLYLIHWPLPARGLYVETWKALVRLREEGRAKSIGVSNFQVPHLDRIIDETGAVPAVNQIELHPTFQQKELRAFHAQKGIATESWSPLGQGKLLENPAIVRLAQKHGKTPAQTIIRWHIDNGLIVIPKSANAQRAASNLDVFDFKLDAEDLQALAALDSADGRLGFHPDTFN